MSLVNTTLPGGSGEAAVGSVLWIASLGSPQVYNPLGNQGNIDWGIKTEFADTTNQGTSWRQRIATLHDGDKMNVEIHFIPSGGGGAHDGATFDGVTPFSPSFNNGLGAVFTQGQLRQYKWVFPDATTWYFQAIIAEFPVNADLTKDILSKVSFQISGQPIFA